MTHCILNTFWLVAITVLLAGCAQQTAPEPHIGYVEADWIYVASPGAGRIETRPVREGTLVKAGDVLFTLEAAAEAAALAEADARVRQSGAQARNIASGARPAEIAALQARLAEAEARLEQARFERDRTATLVARGIAATAKGDKAETDLRAAEASLEAARQAVAVARLSGRKAEREAAGALGEAASAARAASAWRLEQRTVIAAADGRVEETFLDVGEYALPGAPVLALQPDHGLKVRFFVPQAELQAFAPGRAVSINADALETPLQAIVSYVATRAEFTPPVIYASEEREKLVFLVEARLPPGTSLRPGLPVEIVW